MTANHRHTLWQTYMNGWTHGAAVRPLDQKFTEHDNEEIRKAYADGYWVGRNARNLEAQEAAAAYGHEPSIVRLVESGES